MLLQNHAFIQQSSSYSRQTESVYLFYCNFMLEASIRYFLNPTLRHFREFILFLSSFIGSTEQLGMVILFSVLFCPVADQSNTESRTLQDKNNTEIQTKVKIIKPRNNAATSSLIQNSTSITPVNPVVKGSENSVKTTQHPHENSLKANEKDLMISPVEPVRSHKVKSENPKIEKEASNSGDSNSRENDLTHSRETIMHGPESSGTHDPGSGVSEMTGETGSGVTHVPETTVTHSPGSGTTHAPSNVSTEPVINTTNYHSKHVSDQESNPQRTSGSPQKQSIASQQTKMTLTESTKKPSVTDLDNAKSSNLPRTNGVKNGNFDIFIFV